MASASKHDTVPRTGTESVRDSLTPPVQFVGFWTAVVTPFMILALIIAGVALTNLGLLGGLLVANLIGLVLGRNYSQ